jgi:actin related protein 2/3 complex subunit 5
MSDTAFRKIDIDALDEDVLSPSDLYDPDPRGPDGVLADAKSKSNKPSGTGSLCGVKANGAGEILLVL